MMEEKFYSMMLYRLLVLLTLSLLAINSVPYFWSTPIINIIVLIIFIISIISHLTLWWQPIVEITDSELVHSPNMLTQQRLLLNSITHVELVGNSFNRKVLISYKYDNKLVQYKILTYTVQDWQKMLQILNSKIPQQSNIA